MTADDPLPEELDEASVQENAPVLVTLLVVVLAAVGGWLYTVYELNRIVAHEVVRSEALRNLRSPAAARAQAAAAETMKRARADD
jgi:hypothetical protein